MAAIVAGSAPSGCERKGRRPTVSLPRLTRISLWYRQGGALRHRAISQLARPTNHHERGKNPLRQQVARLVRATWSCSKNLIHHLGAINMVICHDTLMQAAV